MNRQFYNIPSQNFKVWRYMNLSKYLLLLESSSLYLARADTLNDPFEGSVTQKTIQSRFIRHSDKPDLLRTIPFAYKKLREFTFVNCWHINETESDGMWKLYLNGNEGIAIQSDYKRLLESIVDDEKSLAFGAINYYDEDYEIPDGLTILTYFHKRLSFKHENEFRILYQKIQNKIDPQLGEVLDLHSPVATKGYPINVDLKKLIENVYVVPTAQQWFFELVASLTKKYCLDVPIKQSTLDNDPIY